MVLRFLLPIYLRNQVIIARSAALDLLRISTLFNAKKLIYTQTDYARVYPRIHRDA